MKRVLIDLPENVHKAMSEQAAQHGRKLKPFLEFIISVQAGHVPPPQVQPVKVKPAQAAQEQNPEQLTREEVAALKRFLSVITSDNSLQ